jgi:hypothetical protein
MNSLIIIFLLTCQQTPTSLDRSQFNMIANPQAEIKINRLVDDIIFRNKIINYVKKLIKYYDGNSRSIIISLTTLKVFEWLERLGINLNEYEMHELNLIIDNELRD